jgi:serine protease Do
MARTLGLATAFLAGWLLARGAGDPQAVAAGGPPDFQELIAAADRGVVHVTTLLPGDRVPGSRDDAVGAGFAVGPDGLLVTSRHVIQGAKQVLVTAEGLGTREAQVVGADDVTDVALLRVPGAAIPPLPLGDPRSLRKGQWVLSAGSPYHLAGSWSAGIVSGLHRSQVGVSLRGFEDFIQTDAAANVGNSGGPLLNARGEVVGMMTAILSRTGASQGVSLAVPIDAVQEAVRRLQGGGGAARPTLGLVVRETDARGTAGGLEVTRFHPGSSAEAAGLRAGDVILSVEGAPTPRASDLQRAVWSRAAGSTVTVVFLRDGRRLQLSVPLR